MSRSLLCGAILILAFGHLLAAEERRSARSWEVVRRDCSTSYNREEITLFGNGTVRLRLQQDDKDDMRLAELDPDEVQAYIRRLEAEDLSEVPEGRDEVLGSMVERCGLFLDLAERPSRRFFFGKFDSLPLGLSRLNAIVNDLYQEADDLAPEGGLPRNYFPEAGDVLVRPDGQRFRVVALTSDRRGVELSGIDEPLTIFVALDSLRQQFVDLVEQQSFP